jgi:hypothetical protein
LNYKHPFPRVSGYSRVYDIKGVDITEFMVYIVLVSHYTMLVLFYRGALDVGHCAML